VAFGPGNILIKVGADTGAAVREFGALNSSLGKTMTTGQKATAALKRAALPAAAVMAAIGVGAKKAIDAAGALNEQVNKTGAVFGVAGKGVVQWSKGLADAFGLSQNAALEAAGTFGNMLVPMGFARSRAAGMSKQLVELAGDLASFNNASPEETLDALRSGLAGESEPLRKFGVFLSDARLKQEALKQGLYSGKGAMDAHAKAAATLAIVMRDTSDAHGDFAKTADSAANQQRVMAAESENLSAELGQSLLPAYQTVQRVMLKVLAVTSQHTGAVKVLVGVVAGLAGAVLAANAALKIWTAVQAIARAATVAYTGAVWLFNAAMSANPIGLVVIALVALGAALVVAYKHSETFRAVVAGALNAVKAAAVALEHGFTALKHAAGLAFDWITAHWKLALFAFGPIGAAVYAIVTNFDKLHDVAAAAFNFITSAFKPGNFAFDAIAGAVGRVAGAFQSVARWAQAAIDAVRALVEWLGKIHVPKIKLPHIPGVNVAPAYFYPPAPSARGAGVTAGAGVTVNVYGAVDPEGTARSIRRILDAHDRRQGRLFG
jgi:hypothetical protein